jgi:hypothetical protein
MRLAFTIPATAPPPSAAAGESRQPSHEHSGRDLRFSLDEFSSQNTPEVAFNYLRRKIEDAGIYVLLAGFRGG